MCYCFVGDLCSCVAVLLVCCCDGLLMFFLALLCYCVVCLLVCCFVGLLFC